MPSAHPSGKLAKADWIEALKRLAALPVGAAKWMRNVC